MESLVLKPELDVKADENDGKEEVAVEAPITIEQKKAKKSEDKLEEAKLAYEAWLDYIEARDEERMMFEEERKKILMWKPPWYPGGKAMF